MKFVAASATVAWLCLPNLAGAQKTRAEVALHATKFDCWTVIGATVYDLTTFIPTHDGGSVINVLCGTDGTLQENTAVRASTMLYICIFGCIALHCTAFTAELFLQRE